MRQVFEAFRLAFDQGRSQREIARALLLSQSTVNEYLRRFRATGLASPLPLALNEAAVEARLFATPAAPARGRVVPDWAAIHAELKQQGVTLQLLWIEYKQQTPDGYHYTQFCRHYRTWADTLEPVLRQVHVAGEKTFVDYAGLTMPVHDRATATVREVQLFVGALGASHLLFAEPTWTQTLPDWIGAHVHMVEYFGGVTALIVPDNLKAAVTQPCYDEPTVHATYQDFAKVEVVERLHGRHSRTSHRGLQSALILQRDVAPEHRFPRGPCAQLARINAAQNVSDRFQRPRHLTVGELGAEAIPLGVRAHDASSREHRTVLGERTPLDGDAGDAARRGDIDLRRHQHQRPARPVRRRLQRGLLIAHEPHIGALADRAVDARICDDGEPACTLIGEIGVAQKLAPVQETRAEVAGGVLDVAFGLGSIWSARANTKAPVACEAPERLHTAAGSSRRMQAASIASMPASVGSPVCSNGGLESCERTGEARHRTSRVRLLGCARTDPDGVRRARRSTLCSGFALSPACHDAADRLHSVAAAHKRMQAATARSTPAIV